MIKEQSAILERDKDQALDLLVDLLPEKQDRLKAFDIADCISKANPELHDKETTLLDKLHKILCSSAKKSMPVPSPSPMG